MKRSRRSKGKNTLVPRSLLLLSIVVLLLSNATLHAEGNQTTSSTDSQPADAPQLMGHRFLTINTVVRVHQIEVTRDVHHGPDESSVHTPAEAKTFREAIETAWPGARITWAFSWLALHDNRPSYRELRELIVSYQKKFSDEVTFIPGAYFSNMYNTRDQVNRDLHEGLKRVSEIVGNGYRPKSVVAGFLSAENLQYLAEVEGIHVCQGNIWSLSFERAFLQACSVGRRQNRLREPGWLDSRFSSSENSRSNKG
jgi:hypothetical protein